MKHYIAITVKFLGPTNTKGSRIKLSLPRWEGKSHTFHYRHDWPTDSADQARRYLSEVNINIESYADMGGTYVLLVSFDQVEKIKGLFKVA